MQRTSFDWRWIGLIVVVALIVNIGKFPWPLLVVLLMSSGGYLLYTGWKVWNRDAPVSGGATKVKYWRGQRIELRDTSSRGANLPPWRAVLPALIYLLMGGALVLGGLTMLARSLGA